MSGSRYKGEQSPQTKSPLFGLTTNFYVRKDHMFTSIDMLGPFAQTCQKAEAETAFSRLLHSAIVAEPESYTQEDETGLAAIAILKRHPELLFVKGTVTDHVGRKIVASPYQLFHGAGDVWALKQIHKEILPSIEGGEAKAQEQFQEQFPNGQLPFDVKRGEAALHDDRNIEQVKQVKETLEKVVTAISVDPCTSGLATLPATTAAVEELRQLFAPTEGEVIRTGLHFPLAILQEIFRVYDEQFVPWSGGQLAFFSREVIGAALAASTVVDGQSYKHGLSKMNFKNGPDRRDGLFCRHPKGIPAELVPLSDKLGRTMFVDPYDGESCFLSDTAGVFNWFNKSGGCSAKVVHVARWRWLGFGKLMRTKNQSLQSLYADTQSRDKMRSRLGV